MNAADRQRLLHMIAAAQEAERFVQYATRQTLETNRQLVLALAMEVAIIGEAAARITEETRLQYPHVPWTAIVGMRNILIHAYFRIDLDILWSTVTVDLPGLVALLQQILQRD